MFLLVAVTVIIIAFLLARRAPGARAIFLGGSGETDPPPLDTSWMCLVELETGGMCGATSIAPGVLVSAAHCATSRPSVVRTSRGVFPVLATVIHPEYDEDTLKNDICLILMDGRAGATMDLPDEPLVDGETCTVCGWGLTEYGLPSRHLRSITVRVVDSRLCSHEYGSDFDGSLQVCAGGAAGGDFCRGDSGGPLFTDDPPTLRGVVSYTGTECASGRPSVYTDVYSYKDWIVSNLSSLTSEKPRVK